MEHSCNRADASVLILVYVPLVDDLHCDAVERNGRHRCCKTTEERQTFPLATDINALAIRTTGPLFACSTLATTAIFAALFSAAFGKTDVFNALSFQADKSLSALIALASTAIIPAHLTLALRLAPGGAFPILAVLV